MSHIPDGLERYNKVEYLHHFRCRSCNNSWSIVSPDKEWIPQSMHCPYCGEKDEVVSSTTD